MKKALRQGLEASNLKPCQAGAIALPAGVFSGTSATGSEIRLRQSLKFEQTFDAAMDGRVAEASAQMTASS